MSGPTPPASSNGRIFAIGMLGWIIPGLIALPLAFGRESSGGESTLFAILVAWGLGVVGCLVAGAMVGNRVGAKASAADPFAVGFAGVAASGVAAVIAGVAVQKTVGVLDLGPTPLLFPIPLLVGYLIGFGMGYAVRRT